MRTYACNEHENNATGRAVVKFVGSGLKNIEAPQGLA
jgi:hypothetical protein